MANKASTTRQKVRIRIEPSQQAGPLRGKPHNPVAAGQRMAGPHAKGECAGLQAAKRSVAKTKP